MIFVYIVFVQAGYFPVLHREIPCFYKWMVLYWNEISNKGNNKSKEKCLTKRRKSHNIVFETRCESNKNKI